MRFGTCRHAKEIAIAFGDQLRGQLRDPIESPRHHVTILGQRLARTIRSVMLVDGAGAHVDEPLEVRECACPLEQRHRAHYVDIDDPGGIFRFGLALRLGHGAT
jgi:hypothetical protein